MLFVWSEFAQVKEWNHDKPPRWELLDRPLNKDGKCTRPSRGGSLSVVIRLLSLAFLVLEKGT